ncbi:glycine betaine ABC transporter substrate-binding protein [Chelatococcus reniformis]|uniref:ABC transporter substrate-binding protein n=1 Tax=Chelatococcus reniformis TaxID=1494448 RepID=A0A916UYJ7_9HYPH|nr:glycine betaine ABC transporter substrate-binding protein [Chelatococcus reniformis]GGC93091.1 ABC transporter substrate-binding protein [Chelatococcus reniformis]
MHRRDLLSALAGLAAAVVRPGRARADQPVVVGSKIDTEGAVLGSLIVAVLRRAGIPVTARLQLGPTSIVRRALLGGEIDLYPEYTGNGAFFFQRQDAPAWRDAAAGYRLVAGLDRANGIVWLPPAPADNTWAIAVRRDVAAANGLASMVDFARWLSTAAGLEAVMLAASAEFVDSPAGLPSFERTYRFAIPTGRMLVLFGGDTAVMIRAAAQRINGVNAAMVYTTDGGIGPAGLVSLSDPEHAQIVYAPAPVVRAATLDRYPAIATSLAPLFKSLDMDALRRLNAAVAVEGWPAEQVATDYLAQNGLAG